MQEASYVVQFDLGLADKLHASLEAQGFSFAKPPYTLFQAKKKGLSCTLYTSGKLVVQGKEMKEFIEFFLEPEILGSFGYGYEEQSHDLSPHIGVDESGKGDFFGPLCVAGVFADEKSIPGLVKLGVKDSKKISDGAIVKIAENIKKDYAYHIVRINPERYNELYDKFGNLNLLLGWGHATVIEQLMDKTGCLKIVIDQFAAEHVVETALKRKNKQALLTQRTKGEEDIVVAAASCLARAAFLEGLEKLKSKWNMEFPKGASQQTIKAGKKIVAAHGPNVLKEVGKLHFKTSQLILELA